MSGDDTDGRTWTDVAQIAFYVICVLALCGTLLLRVVAWLTRAAQDRLVYYPHEPENSHVVCESPLAYGITHAENVQILTADGVTLRGYLMWPPPLPSSTTSPTSAATAAAAAVAALTAATTATAPVTGVVYDGGVARASMCSVTDDCSSSVYEGGKCLVGGHGSTTTTAGATATAAAAGGGGSEATSLHTSLGSHCSGSGGSAAALQHAHQQQQQQQQQRYTAAAPAALSLPTSTTTNAAPAAVAGSLTSPSSSSSASAFALLYFHGNAGNVGHRIEVARLLVTQLRCTLLMVDYRGYGLSSRVEPSQEGLEKDAQACLDYLRHHARVPRDRIFVMGTSLGGAVAIHLASRPSSAHHIRAVIVENTFASLGDMASLVARAVIDRCCTRGRRLAYLFFRCYLKPVALMLRWDSIDAVRRVHVPMLFLSGLEDEIVPAEQMQRLYNAALHRKRLRTFVAFAHGQHNNLMVEPTYLDAIRGFVREVLNRPPAYEHVSD